MPIQLLLAWRNIWRSPKRTLTILTAVIIGIWAMILAGSFMRGMVARMLDNSLAALIGQIQIHAHGFQDDPVVENRIADSAPLETLLRHTLGENGWSLRVRVPGVAANARHSTGVSIVGVQAGREDGLSFYGGADIEGEWLAADGEHDIVIGRALARAMDAKIGSKVVLMSQGADKEMASRAFRIRGIFRAELEATEKQFVFVTLPAARTMLGIGSGVTEAAVSVPKGQSMDALAARLRTGLSPDYEVLTWREMLPVLQGYVGMFDLFLYIWYLVIFVAMSFGIVNTLLMAVLERIREFGLLKALGQSPARIVGGILLESGLILLLGAAIGTTLGLTSVWGLSGGIDLSALSAGSQYLGVSRLIHPVLVLRDVFGANGVVLVLGLLVSLYPAVKAGRITPVKALTAC